MFYKKRVPRNFVKFTGKDLCQSLFFNKVAGRGRAERLAKTFQFKNCISPVCLYLKFISNTLWASYFEHMNATLLKRDSRVFSCEFCKIFKSTFFTERLLCLLLILQFPYQWNPGSMQNFSKNVFSKSFTDFAADFLQFLWSFTKQLKILISLLKKLNAKIIIYLNYMLLTHFQPMCHFYTHWKHQNKLRFSDVFKRYRSRTLVENGLMTFSLENLLIAMDSLILLIQHLEFLIKIKKSHL